MAPYPNVRAALALVLAAAALAGPSAAAPARSREYAALQQRLAVGWNTWDVYSVGAQVLLPRGYTLRVGLRSNSALNADAFLSDYHIGSQGNEGADVAAGPHTWDGSYTEVRVSWRGHAFLLQSAHDGADLVMLATPLQSTTPLPPTLVIAAGVLWNRPGGASQAGDHIEIGDASGHVNVYWTGLQESLHAGPPLASAYFAAVFAEPVGVSTGRPRSLAEIRAVLGRERPKADAPGSQVETVMGWDTIFDPEGSRVISPVSRLWSAQWGGYVLFDWDTFFAATLSAPGDRDLAYANAAEILREETEDGFVPNYARAGGWKSFDRSEPPVGAITVLALYNQYHDVWFLRDTFEALLRWNRWWDKRRSLDGYLVWGSDPGAGRTNPDDPSVGTLQAAKYESGLDNSPMYDGAPFDPSTGKMHVADVGLMGLYVADCNALADIASVLGRRPEEDELRGRSSLYTAGLQTLWDEKSGIFLNRNLDTHEPMRRLSPTNFYPLLGRVATPVQASRMVAEHLMNPKEFWGAWVIPAISRSDPAFRDQDYWRGRIWGPMNYLVYLGLRNYDQPIARRLLAQKSRALFDQEWGLHGHVHENYNADTGMGDDVSSSDRFYHWGALLSLMGEMEPGAGPPSR